MFTIESILQTIDEWIYRLIDITVDLLKTTDGQQYKTVVCVGIFFVGLISCHFPGPVCSYSWFSLNMSFELAVIRDKNYHSLHSLYTESILVFLIEVWVLDDPNLFIAKDVGA